MLVRQRVCAFVALLASFTVSLRSRFSFNQRQLVKISRETEWATLRRTDILNPLCAVADESDVGEQNEDFKSGFCSILGNPNVGKSTLLNAFLGEKLSIVSAKPQTTRHRILGILTEEGKHQMVFSDTPGMVEPAYKLQEAMMESVRTAAGDTDVALVVADVYGEPLIDRRVMNRLAAAQIPIVVAINKIDLLGLNSTSTPPQLPASFSSDLSEETGNSNGELIVKPRRRLLKKRQTQQQQQQLQPPERQQQPLQQLEQQQRQADGREDTDLVGDISEFLEITENSGNKVAKQAKKGEKEGEEGEEEEKDGWGAGGLQGEVRVRDKDRLLKNFPELSAYWRAQLPSAVIVGVSAGNIDGVKPLLDVLLSFLPKGPKYFPGDALTTRDERFFTAEIIREALFHTYQDEVPYSCEVAIDSFEDKFRTGSDAASEDPSLSVIEAAIIVSRESQKKIVVGKQGAKLKALGIQARGQLEQFLGRKVYLSLRVRVDEEWRKNDASLQKYGYIDSDFG